MIIITGGAGFIGSAITAELNTRGITDILIVDELGTDQKWKNLRSLEYSDYMEKGNFLDMITTASKPVPLAQAVIHMGACSSTTETDASYLVRNNFQYTKHLAEWAVNSGIRFIYASSAATYGDGSKGFDDNENNIDQLRPLNMYGYSKQMFDLWAKRNDLLDKIVGLKYFNVFGPNEYHKGPMRSFVLKAFEQINAEGKVRLFKSHRKDYEHGQQLRDFLYITDAVNMTLFFLENKQAAGLFNIGTGKARTWLDLVNAVFAAMGKKADTEFIDMPESIRDQYQYFTEADITKIRSTGYNKPTMPLEDAVQDYVTNYLIPGRHLNE